MDDTEAASEGDVRIGDASVHWRREGSGPPIVFLHGFPLSGRTWDAMISHLRDRFTCHAPDLIGLGGSHSASGEDHASPGQARAIQAVLSTLGLGSYALVGNDTGGWIARELALIDPRVSPLHGAEKLPPSCLVVGTGDPLLAQSNALAAALEGAGVPHEHIVCEGMPHGFLQLEALPPAREALGRAIAFLKKHVPSA